jgi:hypothetical protein
LPILILCLLSSLNSFFHYGFLHGQLKGYTFFIIATFRITIYSLVFYYFCMKGSKLISNKKVTMILFKLMIIFSIIIVTSTGIYIDFIVIPQIKNALLLCKTYFIIIQVSIEIAISLLYLCIFVQIKKSVLTEERAD